jgi:4-hydroxybenzoate polyprenyltransferase
MRPRQKLPLLLASIRLANLPSVVSNVWLGVALGVVFCWRIPPAVYWPAAIQLAVAGMLLYVAGNFLNDWHDRHWDARHRPERALPQGVFAPRLYLGLALGLGLAGLALAAFTSLRSGLVAATIAFCIVLYTRWHKQAAWTVLLMGLCRGLLPLLFFIQWPLAGTYQILHPRMVDADVFYYTFAVQTIVPAELALFLYIAALSLLARGEASRAPSSGKAFMVPSLMVLSGLIMVSIHLNVADPLTHLLGLWPFCLWLGF